MKELKDLTNDPTNNMKKIAAYLTIKAGLKVRMEEWNAVCTCPDRWQRSIHAYNYELLADATDKAVASFEKVYGENLYN